MMLASSRDIIDGTIGANDKRAVTAFSEYCLNNKIALPIVTDEKSQKRLDVGIVRDPSGCLSDIELGTCQNALERFLLGRFRESIPTIRTMGGKWAYYVSVYYPDLYKPLLKSGFAVIESFTPESEDEKQTSNFVAPVFWHRERR